MAFLVKVAVIFPLVKPVSFGRYNHLRFHGLGLSDKLVGIIGSISQDLPCLQPVNQVIGRTYVMDIASSESDPDRIAKSIHYSVDFRCQSAFASANFLGKVPPFAPEPC